MTTKNNIHFAVEELSGPGPEGSAWLVVWFKPGSTDSEAFDALRSMMARYYKLSVGMDQGRTFRVHKWTDQQRRWADDPKINTPPAPYGEYWYPSIGWRKATDADNRPHGRFVGEGL